MLTTQEAENRRIQIPSQPEQIICQNSISKNPSQKKGKGLEWLKVYALSSNPNTEKKRKFVCGFKNKDANMTLYFPQKSCPRSPRRA
jgi:hypothetical protein